MWWNPSQRVRSKEPGSVRISNEARAVVQAQHLAVFHAGRGLMFKANGAGTLIWEALARETPEQRVAEDLALRYGIPAVQAQEDVARFIAELTRAGLVTRAGE